MLYRCALKCEQVARGLVEGFRTVVRVLSAERVLYRCALSCERVGGVFEDCVCYLVHVVSGVLV